MKLAADIVRRHRLTASVRRDDDIEEERTDDLVLRFGAETSRALLRYLVSGEESSTGADVTASLYKLQVPVSLFFSFSWLLPPFYRQSLRNIYRQCFASITF